MSIYDRESSARIITTAETSETVGVSGETAAVVLPWCVIVDKTIPAEINHAPGPSITSAGLRPPLDLTSLTDRDRNGTSAHFERGSGTEQIRHTPVSHVVHLVPPRPERSCTPPKLLLLPWKTQSSSDCTTHSRS